MRSYYCFTSTDQPTLDAALSAHAPGGRVMSVTLYSRETKQTPSGFIAQAIVPGAHAIAIYDEPLSRETLLGIHVAGALLSASDLFPALQDDAERVTEIPPEPISEPEPEPEPEAVDETEDDDEPVESEGEPVEGEATPEEEPAP